MRLYLYIDHTCTIMYFIDSNRASAVLYNWLLSNKIKGKVLMAANICETVPATYYKCGIDVSFCDIEEETLSPNKDEILKLLNVNNDVNILHYNHTYGAELTADDDFLNYIHHNFSNLIIIEDKCLSIPDVRTPINKKNVDLILYSTGHTKVINLGYGGYGITKEKWKYCDFSTKYNSVYETDFDNHIKYCHANESKVNKEIITSNWINTDSSLLPKNYLLNIEEAIPTHLCHKDKINSIYNKYLKRISLGDLYNNWRYNIVVKNQKECLSALFANGLYASNHYKSLGSGYFLDLEFPNCDYIYNHVINLFNDFCYTIEQAERTAKLLYSLAKPL